MGCGQGNRGRGNRVARREEAGRLRARAGRLLLRYASSHYLSLVLFVSPCSIPSIPLTPQSDAPQGLSTLQPEAPVGHAVGGSPVGPIRWKVLPFCSSLAHTRSALDSDRETATARELRSLSVAPTAVACRVAALPTGHAAECLAAGLKHGMFVMAIQ